jgi:uncharacterized membrane protein YphA (DoxX/SURF4 family)
MRQLFESPSLVVGSRIILGSLFLFSSIEKANDPYAFALLIDNYKIFPMDFNLLAASLLPWIELVCGMALLFGTYRHGAALLTGSLTLLFTIAVISGIARDLDISCGCFTLDPDASRIGWQKVAENLGIIVLSAFLVYSKSDVWSIALNRKQAEHGD